MSPVPICRSHCLSISVKMGKQRLFPSHGKASDFKAHGHRGCLCSVDRVSKPGEDGTEMKRREKDTVQLSGSVGSPFTV